MLWEHQDGLEVVVIVYVGLRHVSDFPQRGFCFGFVHKGSPGVGGEASSHVAQSVDSPQIGIGVVLVPKGSMGYVF